MLHHLEWRQAQVPGLATLGNHVEQVSDDRVLSHYRDSKQGNAHIGFDFEWCIRFEEMGRFWARFVSASRDEHCKDVHRRWEKVLGGVESQGRRINAFSFWCFGPT